MILWAWAGCSADTPSFVTVLGIDAQPGASASGTFRLGEVIQLDIEFVGEATVLWTLAPPGLSFAEDAATGTWTVPEDFEPLVVTPLVILTDPDHRELYDVASIYWSIEGYEPIR